MEAKKLLKIKRAIKNAHWIAAVKPSLAHPLPKIQELERQIAYLKEILLRTEEERNALLERVS